MDQARDPGESADAMRSPYDTRLIALFLASTFSGIGCSSVVSDADQSSDTAISEGKHIDVPAIEDAYASDSEYIRSLYPTASDFVYAESVELFSEASKLVRRDLLKRAPRESYYIQPLNNYVVFFDCCYGVANSRAVFFLPGARSVSEASAVYKSMLPARIKSLHAERMARGNLPPASDGYIRDFKPFYRVIIPAEINEAPFVEILSDVEVVR